MSESSETQGANGWETDKWKRYYFALLAILFIVAILTASRTQQYVFNPITTESVIALLTPLFLIALFVERAQEVFITSWRGFGMTGINEEVRKARKAPNQAGLTEALAKRALYKAKTARIAFLAGLSVGILVSIAGVRVLFPLVSWDMEVVGSQGTLFNILDIVLTGGLIGGGSEGIHRVMSLILDFVDSNRAKLSEIREAEKAKLET